VFAIETDEVALLEQLANFLAFKLPVVVVEDGSLHVAIGETLRPPAQRRVIERLIGPG
jgi:hypothetical protein